MIEFKAVNHPGINDQMIAGLLYQARTGSLCRDLPDYFGTWGVERLPSSHSLCSLMARSLGLMSYSLSPKKWRSSCGFWDALRGEFSNHLHADWLNDKTSLSLILTSGVWHAVRCLVRSGGTNSSCWPFERVALGTSHNSNHI